MCTSLSFDAVNQAGDVARIESHSASEVHRAELAAVDEALDRSRVDVEECCGFDRRQKRRLVGGRRRGRAILSCCAAALPRGAFGSFVAPSRSLSRRAPPGVVLRRLGRLVGVEEGELARVKPHEKWGNLSGTGVAVNTGVDSVAVTSAQIIREARLKAELTQTELAQRIGRDRAQVARWETGGQEPSFENLQAVVAACGFVLKVEIAEREEDLQLDTEIETSLVQAPQQRVTALLDGLGEG
jgi:transcriptional regulator with XRE-family HTH domain